MKELLNYIKDNAFDVADLAAVVTIESSEPGDPYRKTLLTDLRLKYEDAYGEFERECIFDGKENPYEA